jgi:hypothetical protein
MSDEIVKRDAEIVDIGNLDERMVKAFENIAKKTYIEIQRTDRRAVITQRTEQGEIPSDVATFVHIDEEKQDELGSPFELDVKGTITIAEAAHFKDVNFAIALANLKDWKYFNVDVEQRDGTIKKEQVPINLAQIDMLSKKRLNMGIGGEQSKKHINSLRAGAGMSPEESFLDKAGSFFGWKRGNKQQMQDDYGMQRR